MKEKERRRHERVNLPYKIILTLSNLSFNGSLKDISACGASCYIDDQNKNIEIEIGSIVSFALASDSSYLKFEGTVVRIEDEAGKKLIGISFY
ncbi:MAG: PilZ domain-containing protein [Exilispira sp.]